MSETIVTPAVSAVTASDLKAGDWAYVPGTTAGGESKLLLMTDQASPKPVSWQLIVEPSGNAFRAGLHGDEKVLRLDCKIRVVLAEMASPNIYDDPPTEPDALLVATSAETHWFAAPFAGHTKLACVRIDGTGTTEEVPNDCVWWKPARIEYQASGCCCEWYTLKDFATDAG